jgi:hypothetical protein
MREDELKNNYSENWIQDEISEREGGPYGHKS